MYRTFHSLLLQSKSSFGQVVSEEKILIISANHKQELPVAAMLGNFVEDLPYIIPAKFGFNWPSGF